jgi:hypothetical protein
MARHRIHNLAFKKQIAPAYAAGAILNGSARRHHLTRNLVRIWIASPKAESSTLISKPPATRPALVKPAA